MMYPGIFKFPSLIYMCLYIRQIISICLNNMSINKDILEYLWAEMLLRLQWQIEKLWLGSGLDPGLNSISPPSSVKRKKYHNITFAIVTDYSNVINCSRTLQNILVRRHSKSTFVVEWERGIFKKGTETNRRGVKPICTFTVWKNLPYFWKNKQSFFW